MHTKSFLGESLPSLIVEFDALTVTSQGLAGIAFPNTDNAGIERHRAHLPRSLLGRESAQVRHGVLVRVYKKSIHDKLNNDTVTKWTWSEQLCASCIALQELLSLPSVIGDHGWSPVLACLLLALVHRACMENRLASCNINLGEQGHSHNHCVLNTCLHMEVFTRVSLGVTCHMQNTTCRIHNQFQPSFGGSQFCEICQIGHNG